MSKSTATCPNAPAPTGFKAAASTRTSVPLSWNSVNDAYRYKLERRTGSSGSWSSVNSSITGTSRTATGLTCNTAYQFRLSARGDGSPYSTTFGATSSVSKKTEQCEMPPTVGADPQNPFTGQSVTLTASASASGGTISSYQWQEWSESGGAWTNLGGASRSATLSVSSSTEGVKIFKVRVAYKSGAISDSLPVMMEWLPILVAVTASSANPESGKASKRTVTLTAVADAPQDVTYQWQQEDGNRWVNLGSPTTSTTQTVSFTTRGTRKFRVQVSHASASSATSEPVHLTWDEGEIVEEMITALQIAITGDAGYTSAQTALVDCMNISSAGASGAGAGTVPVPATSQYASFNHVLADYTGAVKSKMDTNGDCSSKTTIMFDTIKSLFRSKIAGLKTAKAEYASLLNTPHGRQFEARFGSGDTFKQDASLLATVIALDQPQPDSAAATGGFDSIAPTATHGFEDCLPRDIAPDLAEKFRTLNCLQFEKPHLLWVVLHGKPNKQKAFKKDLDRYDWLQYDNFTCSYPMWLENVPATHPGDSLPCMKHDVSYSSLQNFVKESEKSDATIDSAWNPRNKYFADHLFVIDGICGMKVSEKRRKCVQDAAANHSVIGTLYKVGWWLPKITHYGVSHFNNKKWPITEQDAEHARENPVYLSCDVTKVDNPRIEHRSGRKFEASWTLTRGCVKNTPIHSYVICYEVKYSTEFVNLLSDNSKCQNLNVNDSPAIFDTPLWTKSVMLESMQIRPDDTITKSVDVPNILIMLSTPQSKLPTLMLPALIWKHHYPDLFYYPETVFPSQSPVIRD